MTRGRIWLIFLFIATLALGIFLLFGSKKQSGKDALHCGASSRFGSHDSSLVMGLQEAVRI